MNAFPPSSIDRFQSCPGNRSHSLFAWWKLPFNRSKEVPVKLRVVADFSLFVLIFAIPLLAQVDPGIRPTPTNVGNPLPSVLANNPPTILDFFKDGADRFQEVDSVSGNLPNEAGSGLGPRFNS